MSCYCTGNFECDSCFYEDQRRILPVSPAVDLEACAKAAYYAARPWARLAWEKQNEAEQYAARVVALAVLKAAGVKT